MVPGRGLAVWRCGIHKEHRVAKNLRGDRKRAGCGARARSAGVAQASAGALATAQAAWRGASAAGLGGTGGPHRRARGGDVPVARRRRPVARPCEETV